MAVTFSLVFIGFFAVTFEFDIRIARTTTYPMYIFVSILTLFLFLLNLLETMIIKKRNNSIILLQNKDSVNLVWTLIRLVCSLISPNIFFVRKKFFIKEILQDAENHEVNFHRNINEYLYIF